MLHMMQLVPGVELSAGNGHNHTTITLTFHAAYAIDTFNLHRRFEAGLVGRVGIPTKNIMHVGLQSFVKDLHSHAFVFEALRD